MSYLLYVLRCKFAAPSFIGIALFSVQSKYIATNDYILSIPNRNKKRTWWFVMVGRDHCDDYGYKLVLWRQHVS